jgi:hypothetical protein
MINKNNNRKMVMNINNNKMEDLNNVVNSPLK